MFFLIRSAFCIGVVALMLPGNEGPSTVRDVAVVTRNAAAAGVRHYCVGHGDCVAAGARVAGLLLGTEMPPRMPTRRGSASADTLGAADLIPAWNGPKPRLGG
ncbi:MAG TPA: hypothetical protein VH414_04135 [Lichenihabitans sp.]|jgi:hypothetical protein|nr:hypothetical protein [Lichenihabitans sp.]